VSNCADCTQKDGRGQATESWTAVWDELAAPIAHGDATETEATCCRSMSFNRNVSFALDLLIRTSSASTVRMQVAQTRANRIGTAAEVTFFCSVSEVREKD
jgi:hypothetical protein